MHLNVISFTKAKDAKQLQIFVKPKASNISLPWKLQILMYSPIIVCSKEKIALLYLETIAVLLLLLFIQDGLKQVLL